MKPDNQFLGTEPVGKLLLKLGIPTVTFTAILFSVKGRKTIRNLEDQPETP